MGEEVRVKTKAAPASPTYTRSEILEEEGDTVLWRLWRSGWTVQSGVSIEYNEIVNYAKIKP